MYDYDPLNPSVRCPDCTDGGDPGSPHSSPPDPCRTCGGWQRVPFVAQTDAFLAAIRERDTRTRERDEHRERTVREMIVPAYEAAVRAARPRAPAFMPPGGGWEKLYYEVRDWALKHLKKPLFDAVEAPFVAPFTERQEELTRRIDAAREEIDRLAPWAVFRATAERIEVYRPYPGAYSSQGHGEDSYLQADCAIRVAILRARGFDAETTYDPGTPMTTPNGQAEGRVYGRGWYVRANAPPEVRHALPGWRLDDQRLLDTTHPANLKVLFSGLFPYAGSWDWPASSRERRDHASFGLHRANEDAHLNLNGRPSCPRLGAPCPDPRACATRCVHALRAPS